VAIAVARAAVAAVVAAVAGRRLLLYKS